MIHSRFTMKERIRSFGFAFNGLKILFREEQNSRIHIIAMILTILAGIYFGISIIEWIIVLFAIGLVITMEIVNTSIENIADYITPEKCKTIKKIKDLGAAGVLVSSLTALAIGIIIFIPKLLSRLF